MAKLTFKELNDTLDAAIEVGGIYNPDFQDLKTYAASRNLDADVDKAREDHYYPLLRANTCPDEIDEMMSSIGNVSIVISTSSHEKAMMDRLEAGQTRLEGYKLSTAIHQAAQIIIWLGKDLENTTKRITEWAPRPLPTGKV